MKHIKIFSFAAVLLTGVLLCASCGEKNDKKLPTSTLLSCTIDGRRVANGKSVSGVPLENVEFLLEFTAEIDASKLDIEKIWFNNFGSYQASQKDPYTLRIVLTGPLKEYTSYSAFVLSGDHLGIHLVGDYSR